MEVGNEISNKIRSAIKAKLIDLDVYVDEELPDYIMVMVANKKSQHQMTEDLSLFLGNNTDTFTTWLHSLLQKLQSITSEPTASSTAIFSKAESVVETLKPKGDDKSGSRHKRNTEKQTADESKHRKRPSDEGTDEPKRRKSDKEKSKAEDDLKLNPKLLPGGKGDSSSNSEPIVGAKETAEKATLQEKNIEPEKVPSYIPLESRTEKSVKTPEVPETLDLQKTTETNNIQVTEDDDLAELLLTEADELTEELERETVIVPPKKHESDSPKTSLITISDEEVHPKRQRGAASIIFSGGSSRGSSPPRSSRPKVVTSPIRQTGRRSAVVRAVEPRPSEVSSRKRRGPTSIVGSVTHDSEEDGYDPRNPAVGNVASVVKVTARKSSVPLKLQANKSLLLKAVSEAKESVESQRRVAITPVRPFMRSEGRDRERDRDRDRDRERSSRSSSSSLRSSSHPSSRLAQTSLHQAINQPRSGQSDMPVYIPTRKVQPAPRVESVERVGIVSRSRRQEAQQRAWLDEEDPAPARKMIKREKSTPIVNFIIETEYNPNAEGSPAQNEQPVKVKMEPVSPRQNPLPPDLSLVKDSKKEVGVVEIDSRVVEYEPEVVASPAENVSESGSQGVPLILDDMEQEEFMLDQDVLEVIEPTSAVYEEDLRLPMVKEKPKDKTRFVVTLDGVDTDQYEMEVGESGQVEEQMMGVEQTPLSGMGIAVAAPPLAQAPAPMMAPPKIQPLNISLKDSDEEGEAMEAEPTPLKQAKMMERCKFWPACVNGSACSYHHPTVHCKTFPMCKFGDKCLYIHPNCRFDSKCTRPDCPFTHSSRRSVPAFPVPHGVPMLRPPMPSQHLAPVRGLTPPHCKFFPACNNMSCPFFHPKPCRFGLACKNKDKGCSFFHPALPTVDKLTWVAGKGATSSSLVLASGAAKDTKKID